MISQLKKEAMEHKDALRILSADRLQDLEKEIAHFAESTELNGFQKWIVGQKYQFSLPKTDFPINSILIVAIPHPFYAKVAFEKNGRICECISLIMPDFQRTESYLKDFLSASGYHLKAAPNLPLKRTAARSGLAVYGRNNICYVDGMGSSFSFAAYYSDIPCTSGDDWTQMRTADTCNSCRICFNSCPTGAIREDRFLIDNERCLSCLNEVPGTFPQWLPRTSHHCLYDCMKCQIRCPMNKPYAGDIAGPFRFDEEETRLLMSGSGFDAFPQDLRQKSEILGLKEWLPAIPRNMQILFELYDGEGIKI